MIVVNKWDAVEKDNATMNEFTKVIRERLQFISFAPIIYISALTGQRIHTVLETVHRVWQNRSSRLPTSEVNQIIRDAVERHAPPNKGQSRLKILYGSQVRTDPPIFLLHEQACSIPAAQGRTVSDHQAKHRRVSEKHLCGQ